MPEAPRVARVQWLRRAGRGDGVDGAAATLVDDELNLVHGCAGRAADGVLKCACVIGCEVHGERRIGRSVGRERSRVGVQCGAAAVHEAAVGGA
eukprot:111761-Chlamydomonas_euryale.AAC.1